MSPERHEKDERSPPVSWRPCAGVQPRSSVQLVAYHSCQRSGTTCCSASDHLKESHDTAVKAQGKATRTAWQSTIISGRFWFIRILQLLISRECFWGEAEREWWEAEVTCALHCVLWETKHPSARSPQWKSEQSNSFSPQQCKWWSWNCAVWQGSRISKGIPLLCLSFKPKLMMLLYWGIFIAKLIRDENKSSIFQPISRMSWPTAEEKP